MHVIVEHVHTWNALHIAWIMHGYCRSIVVMMCVIWHMPRLITCPDWSHVNCTTSLLYPKPTSTVALLESLKAAAWLLLLPCLVCVCEQLQSRIHGNASSMLSHMQFGQGPPRHQLISAFDCLCSLSAGDTYYCLLFVDFVSQYI